MHQPRLVDRDIKDEGGFWWRVRLPDGCDDINMSIPVGPPDLTTLGLPLDVHRRLHNQLHARGLITARDVRGHMMEVKAAIQAAYHVDAQTVTALYV